ncbi:YchJ family protein [Candidatus Neptunochlamydia vexilliferae]|uniref:UPF0225 protein YchJ n=1 Tax=Candidatus Neptunichlamydia vexilliferae TaxID=1651774 RepID=A0ABS0B0A1_9BACT|nr:YchJ family metal-binding protein [Candidatus Neptunochlamydia vexilliferae]MBF5059823.1 UPF0225 protein YchJ [Candidatus Neptunochlamydia vexilliferae]
MICPCGSGRNYTDCCAPYVEGEKDAPTPEALMRSRYTAYHQNNLDYIEKTMQGEPTRLFKRAEAEGQNQETEWLTLTVYSSEEKGNRGTVSFLASFRYQGKAHGMQETSLFEKIEGKWYYTDRQV